MTEDAPERVGEGSLGLRRSRRGRSKEERLIRCSLSRYPHPPSTSGRMRSDAPAPASGSTRPRPRTMATTEPRRQRQTTARRARAVRPARAPPASHSPLLDMALGWGRLLVLGRASARGLFLGRGAPCRAACRVRAGRRAEKRGTVTTMTLRSIKYVSLLSSEVGPARGLSLCVPCVCAAVAWRTSPPPPSRRGARRPARGGCGAGGEQYARLPIYAYTTSILDIPRTPACAQCAQCDLSGG